MDNHLFFINDTKCQLLIISAQFRFWRVKENIGSTWTFKNACQNATLVASPFENFTLSLAKYAVEGIHLMSLAADIASEGREGSKPTLKCILEIIVSNAFIFTFRPMTKYLFRQLQIFFKTLEPCCLNISKSPIKMGWEHCVITNYIWNLLELRKN